MSDLVIGIVTTGLRLRGSRDTASTTKRREIRSGDTTRTLSAQSGRRFGGSACQTAVGIIDPNELSPILPDP